MRDDTCVSTADSNVARVSVRVKPGSSRTRVGGRYEAASGAGRTDALIVAVSAPAVDGRANEAVCSALAEELGIPARDVVVVAGARARSKVLCVTTTDPQHIRARLDDLMGPRGVSGQAGQANPA